MLRMKLGAVLFFIEKTKNKRFYYFHVLLQCLLKEKTGNYALFHKLKTLLNGVYISLGFTRVHEKPKSNKCLF